MEQYRLSELVGKAYQIAVVAHSGQVDKAGVDYIKHPLAVASLVSTLLHDVLEDSEWTANQLRAAGIPEEVVTAAEVLTKQKGISYDVYLSKVKLNPIAGVVKLADLRNNSDLSRLC